MTGRYDVEYAEHLRIMMTMYTEFLLATLQWPEVRAHILESLVVVVVSQQGSGGTNTQTNNTSTDDPSPPPPTPTKQNRCA